MRDDAPNDPEGTTHGEGHRISVLDVDADGRVHIGVAGTKTWVGVGDGITLSLPDDTRLSAAEVMLADEA